MNTDPLCPQQHTHPKHSPNRCIFCEYGEAVRADALDAAEAAVKALIHSSMCDCESCWWKADALDAIRALKEKP